MTSIPYTRAADRVETPENLVGEIDITPLLGTWINSNRATKGLTRFVLAKKKGVTTLHAFANDSPFDWGELEIVLYADSINSQKTVAFNANYDFGFMESFLAANTNKGLIIIAAYNKFKDDSQRSNYFSREFYFQETA